MLKDDQDDDILDDEELEQLIHDESQSKYKSLQKDQVKSGNTPFPAVRIKQKTTANVGMHLDKFSFADSVKKTTPLSTKKPNTTVRKDPSKAKLLNFGEGENKPNQMQQMTDDQIQEGLPEFLQNEKKTVG